MSHAISARFAPPTINSSEPDPVEENFLALAISVFRQAQKDLGQPNYRHAAHAWLHSHDARYYSALIWDDETYGRRLASRTRGR